MDKFLIFIDAADDAAMYPMSRFLGMTVAADATILVKFSSSVGSFGTDGSAKGFCGRLLGTLSSSFREGYHTPVEN